MDISLEVRVMLDIHTAEDTSAGISPADLKLRK
jgi:hypothetical protein